MRLRSTAATAVTVLALTTMAACGDDADPASETPATSASEADPTADASDAPDDPTSGTADEGTSEDTGEDTTPDEGGTGASEATVPAYWVGSTPQGLRLYREFRSVPGDDPLTEAAALVVGGTPDDPDYETLFPVGHSVSSVVQDDDGYTVTLSDDALATRPGSMTRRQAVLALQQVVWTVQGVGQDRAPVSFEVAGEPVQVLGLDATDVGARDQLSTLALVNITMPAEGASVSGTFTASGRASSFEATVPWQVLDGEEVVAEGFATAEGWMDRLYPWETEVDVTDLPAGEYTFVASTSDPSDGEGPGATVDTRTITVD